MNTDAVARMIILENGEIGYAPAAGASRGGGGSKGNAGAGAAGFRNTTSWRNLVSLPVAGPVFEALDTAQGIVRKLVTEEGPVRKAYTAAYKAFFSGAASSSNKNKAATGGKAELGEDDAKKKVRSYSLAREVR